ncbi:DnaJ-like cysteine-rich domain-containing protein, partial [Shewanella sp. 0m-11]
MSKLQQFQDFIRSNGEKITGVNVPVVLSDEQAKDAQLKFNFGWRVEIGVSRHKHGGRRPSGIASGSSSRASQEANKSAQEYVSGRNPLFNERFLKILGPDVSKNFLIKNTNLNSAPDVYVGEDLCNTCNGSGCVRCRSCRGSGKLNCLSCSGSGRVSVSRYDSYNERTVYTTETCSTCYGSGNRTCTSCNGSGDTTCGTCDGSGYLYYSYTIDGEAKRSTKWFYTSSDYHEWTDDFVKRTGLNVVHCVNDITEIDVKDELDGCTFIYGFTAVLPTLQFTASIDKVDTKMCFAGKQNLTHDAGGVYDPAVWQVAQQLGAGSKSDDMVALATPAIKDIIEARETKSKIALLEENWVSTDIKDAIGANYDSLIGQLKKQSIKGIVPKMLGSLVKYTALFFTLAVMIALLFPHFAEDATMRMGIMEYPQWIIALLSAEFALFGIHPFANYVF